MNEIVQLYKTLTSSPWAAQLLAKTATHPMAGRVMDVVNGPIDPKKDLAETGLTAERREAYVPLVSSLLAENVSPLANYTDQESTRDALSSAAQRAVGMLPPLPNDSAAADAWRLYLGVPQKQGTFDISDYRPSREGTGEPVPHYYKISNFLQDYIRQADEDGVAPISENDDRADPNPPDAFPTEADMVRYLVEQMRSGGEPRMLGTHEPSRPMGDFTWEQGSDASGPYISYYDRWDLAPTLRGANAPVMMDKLIGKPFEIYDRIYYDPQTYAPRQPAVAPAPPPPAPPMRPDPIALSPYAGLVQPSRRPPAPALDWRKVPSPYDGLFTQHELDRQRNQR